VRREAVGAAISDEIRAYANLNQSMQQSQGQDIFSPKGLNDGRGIGVTEWGPSLNMYRDPRWYETFAVLHHPHLAPSPARSTRPVPSCS
jgi:hypothetical protein